MITRGVVFAVGPEQRHLLSFLRLKQYKIKDVRLPFRSFYMNEKNRSIFEAYRVSQVYRSNYIMAIITVLNSQFHSELVSNGLRHFVWLGESKHCTTNFGRFTITIGVGL